jgi:hypothetical protein
MDIPRKFRSVRIVDNGIGLGMPHVPGLILSFLFSLTTYNVSGLGIRSILSDFEIASDLHSGR